MATGSRRAPFPAERSTTLQPPACFACHNNLKKDALVISTYVSELTARRDGD